MGLIRKTMLGGAVSAAAAVGYLGGSTTVISPIPAGDAIWASKMLRQHNRHRNPSTQDICEKQVPLAKVRPELLLREGDLALELCRGVWSGLGEPPHFSLAPCAPLHLPILEQGERDGRRPRGPS